MKALICITTANRCLALKRFIWDYASFCSRNPDFRLLVSLDGNDPDTIAFCRKNRISLLYSDEREGVGISKNRVLTRFPDFDHYFFIEDDVGLKDDTVFRQHIDVAREMGLHHLSLFPPDRLPPDTSELRTPSGRHLTGAQYGGATFNYFSNFGIRTVGGFHPMFATYRRFGHTEHSYRFVHAGLAKYPFYVLTDCLNSLRWSDPVSVTRIKVPTVNRIFEGEHNLIQQRLTHAPITTLSPFHHLEFDPVAVAKTPIRVCWYRLAFDGQMLMLDAYRTIKRMWPARHA